MSNGWTGGQYSVLRVLLGAYLLFQFGRLAPAAIQILSTGATTGVGRIHILELLPTLVASAQVPAAFAAYVSIGILTSLLLTIGLWHRVASAVLLLWVLVYGPLLIADVDRKVVAWLLLAHLWIPAAPYGSWAARHRENPGGGWRMPDGIFAGMWVVLGLTYFYLGATRLLNIPGIDLPDVMRAVNPQLLIAPATRFVGGLPGNWVAVLIFSAAVFELLFAPLALIRPLRPWLWVTMLILQIAVFVVVWPPGWPAGLLLLHLFAFDPGWLPPRRYLQFDWLLYDGACGLCHRSVRFVLAEDLFHRFRFAPLGGTTARDLTSSADPATLPDSVIVVTEDGAILTRFAAVRYILRQLGGLWRVLWIVTAIVPSPLGNVGYDFIARVRHKLFAKPDDVCPLLPAHLRDRFEV
jgi:predicted DCC family thiol-disulfide oxidoreductase YuxK